MTVLQSSSSEQTPFLGHPILWHCICGPQKSGSCANEFTSSTKSEQLCCISRYSWVLRLMLVEKSYNLLLDLYYNNICLAPSKYFTEYSKFNLRLWYSPWSMFQSFIECYIVLLSFMRDFGAFILLKAYAIIIRVISKRYGLR